MSDSTKPPDLTTLELVIRETAQKWRRKGRFINGLQHKDSATDEQREAALAGLMHEIAIEDYQPVMHLLMLELALAIDDGENSAKRNSKPRDNSQATGDEDRAPRVPRFAGGATYWTGGEAGNVGGPES